ncbi:uncharacterized protein TRAVEDRAFT_23155 [Trametes versicolor FP-101664 SS1]|uniref:uncharacterized protein n=1 Tax=Trametes versicolor (strain FP-101664) TaxID=717944 RepID=UPI00046234A7|nr:uncharacterized protein TRAVEDRAFT_23155 [Trametes versicolor FP-101664 SS1]EIW53885.1 hypothetical protein TRAVEDRAFT_23155 [Trametes versicolor FP-101664 SS1]
MLSTTFITAFTLFATVAQVQGATIPAPAASSTATPCTSVVFVTKTAMPTSVLTVTKHTTSTAVPKGKLVSSPQGTYAPRRRADVTPTTTVTVVKTSTATDTTMKTVTSTSTTTSTLKTTLTATSTAKVTSTQTQTSTVTSPVTKVVTATATGTRTATVTAFTTDAETSTATVTTTVGEKTVTEGDVARRALPTAA